MLIEGMVINKTPVKARDLIAKLLLRNGKVISVYFYGGQGGGKKQKGSLVELGHMLKIVLAPRKKHLETELAVAKEWNLVWDSHYIRKDVLAFYFMCFIFEVIGKIAINQELSELDHDHGEHGHNEYQGIFNVVSNALFYADKALQQNALVISDHLFIFVSKLIYQLGIVPSLSHCTYCNISLDGLPAVFETHQGGMACGDCLRQKDQSNVENKLLQMEFSNSEGLRRQMQQALELPYQEFFKLTQTEKGMIFCLFNHLCYQFQFSPQDFKTRSMLF